VPRPYDPPVIVGVFAHRVVMLRSATAAGLPRFVLLMLHVSRMRGFLILILIHLHNPFSAIGHHCHDPGKGNEAV